MRRICIFSFLVALIGSMFFVIPAECRYYEPQIGRFLQEDPEEGYLYLPETLNKYIYTGNNPVNWVDPLGLEMTPATYDYFITLPGIYTGLPDYGYSSKQGKCGQESGYYSKGRRQPGRTRGGGKQKPGRWHPQPRGGQWGPGQKGPRPGEPPLGKGQGGGGRPKWWP